MGRPPKLARDKWSARVMVRMTQRDRKRLGAEAEAAGMSLGRFLVECWRKKGS